MKGREQNQKTTPPLALPLETVARRAIREMRGRQRIFIRPQARTTLQPATRPARAAGSSAPVGPLCRFWVLGFGPRRGPGFGFGAGPPARARKIDRYTTRQTSEHAWMMNLVGCPLDSRPTTNRAQHARSSASVAAAVASWSNQPIRATRAQMSGESAPYAQFLEQLPATIGGRLPAGPAGGRLPGEGRSPRRPAARRLAAPRARIGGGGVSGGGLEAGGIGW